MPASVVPGTTCDRLSRTRSRSGHQSRSSGVALFKVKQHARVLPQTWHLRSFLLLIVSLFLTGPSTELEHRESPLPFLIPLSLKRCVVAPLGAPLKKANGAHQCAIDFSLSARSMTAHFDLRH
jgi:hypothetical protein